MDVVKVAVLGLMGVMVGLFFKQLPYHYKRSGDFCSSVLLCRMRDDTKLLHLRLFQMP